MTLWRNNYGGTVGKHGNEIKIENYVKEHEKTTTNYTTTANRCFLTSPLLAVDDLL